MIFREAKLSDIPQIQVVRHSVKENTLSDPALVTDEDCADFLTRRGKGWVCVVDGNIAGFSIVDLTSHNVWALFVRPEHEQRGMGRRLLQMLLEWYFSQTKETIWLGTAPHTRAADFYRSAGWTETGTHGKGEIKFEMRFEDWGLLSAEP